MDFSFFFFFCFVAENFNEMGDDDDGITSWCYFSEFFSLGFSFGVRSGALEEKNKNGKIGEKIAVLPTDFLKRNLISKGSIKEKD